RLAPRPAHSGHARGQDRSIRGPRRTSVAHHRQEHPRPRRLSRDLEMIRAVLVLSILAAGFQAPPRADKAPTDGWPSYNGDYSGRRFSPLTKINDRNVKGLSLGWSYRRPAAG